MLLFFNVENFKSFSQKTTLHLTPTHSALFLEHVHQVGKGGGRSILGAAVISGANASGKTNLVSALLDSRDYIVKGVLQDSPIPCAVPFALDPAKRSEGSRFEYTFSIDDNLYFYGFVVRASAVCEEWLFEIDGKETKRIFFPGSIRKKKLTFITMKTNPYLQRTTASVTRSCRFQMKRFK